MVNLSLPGFGGLVGKPADSTEKKEEETEEDETPPKAEKVAYRRTDAQTYRHASFQTNTNMIPKDFELLRPRKTIAVENYLPC